jgi:hypothetical protein
MRYAAKTQVSANRSRDEIERTLTRYGASGFLYGWQQDMAMLAFTYEGKQIKFLLELPDKQEFRTTPTGRARRNEDAVVKEWEQATRQKWRALSLVIKAKLEGIESGISTFEDEFMAWIVTADGKQVRDHVLPRIEEMYRTGKMQKLLPAKAGE